MRIGDLERRTGVPRRLLRYYEEQDLLHPKRDSSGYRVYEEGHVALVARIRQLLDAGLGTDVIRGLLPWSIDGENGLAPCGRILGLLSDHLSEMDERIAELTRRRELLAGIDDATRARPVPERWEPRVGVA